MQKKSKVDIKTLRATFLRAGKEAGRQLYHHPVLALLIVLLVGTIGWNQQHATSTLKVYKGIHVATQEAEIGQLQIIEMKEKGASICAYRCSEEQTLKVKKPDRQTSVELYQVAGNMELMPVRLLTGTWPKGDEAECVIDKETSYSLFGDELGTGNTLWLDNHKYKVVGIIESQVKTAYFFEQDLTTTYDRLLIQGDKEQTELALETLPSASILSKVAYEKVNECVEYIHHLPVWIAIILLWFVLFSWVRGNPLKTVLIVLIGIALLYLTHFHFYIPEMFIPERWSRLEFYPEAFGKLQEAIRNYMKMIKGCFEGQYLMDIVRVMVTSLVLILLEMVAAVRVTKHKNK